jgi:hypothetical protein
MKEKFTQDKVEGLIKGARIAVQAPGNDDFWKQVSDRMKIRDESKKEMVIPREFRR